VVEEIHYKSTTKEHAKWDFANEDTTEVTHYFHKLKIKIIYKEMTETSAKEILIEYLCTKKSAFYFHNDSDFLAFQKAYVEIINANHLTKLVRYTSRLQDMLTFTDFKEKILKSHKELLQR